MSLKINEDIFRMLFEHSLEGLLIAKPDGSFHEVNDSFCKMLGYTRKELLRLSRSDITVSNSHLETALKIRREKGSVRGVLRMIRKDGGVIDTEVSSALFADKNGEEFSYVSIRDITEKLIAETKVTQSEANLNAILNNISDSIFSVSKNFKIIFFNQTFFDATYYHTGISFKEGDDFFNDGVTKEMQNQWHKHLERAFAGERFKIEESFTFQGNTHYSEISFNPIRQANEISGVVCFSRNITGNKLNEQRLQNNEKRFRALIENSHDIISLNNADGSIQYMSPAAKSVLGYDPEKMIGRNPFENIHNEDMPRLMELFGKIMAQPGSTAKAEWRQKHVNGTWLWMEGVATNLLHDPAVNAIVDNFRDITEWKIAEQKLKKAAEELNQIFNNVDEGLFAMDIPTRKYLHVSAGCERIYGYTIPEFFANGRLWYEVIHPDDRTIVDGNEGKINSGEHCEMRFRIFNKDQSVRWVEVKIIPTLSDLGILTRVDGIVKDITSRKQAEEEFQVLNQLLEKKVSERTQQLNEANQMLQSFSYSVAHDLQAPLRILKGYATVLKEEHVTQLDAEGQRLLSVIITYASSMTKLIADLLNFSLVKRSPLSISQVNNNNMVNGVIETIKQMYPEAAPLIMLNELGYCDCDPNLMKQVWLNLISNAVKFSRNVAHPLVEIGREQSAEGSVYYVKDNGVGFDMQHTHKLFEVFHRLHSQREFEGTGVGLALANTIVTKHGGKIWARAEINRGATFYFVIGEK